MSIFDEGLMRIPPPPLSIPNRYEPEPSLLFELGARAEQIPLTITDYREMIVLIRRMSSLSTYDRLPEAHREVCLHTRLFVRRFLSPP